MRSQEDLIHEAQKNALAYGRKSTIRKLKNKRNLLLKENDNLDNVINIIELKFMIDYLKGKF